MICRPYRAFTAVAVGCLVLQGLFLALACGGNDDQTGLTTRNVSDALAAATTDRQMSDAFTGAFRITQSDRAISPFFPYGAQTPPEVRAQLETAQLRAQEGAYPTLAEAYRTVNDHPLLAGIRFALTADQLVARINALLPAAYAHPNEPANAVLVLLSSRPGEMPFVAPTLATDTRLSPIQAFMLTHYLATQVPTRSLCTNLCDAAYYAAVGAITVAYGLCVLNPPVGGAGVCNTIRDSALNLASNAHAACLEACHNQGGG
ncbi:MAG: hypothetical protein KIS66_00535 [Fimbriimonadaceae bacterium]|nr:hypothetical protein [Fimbriimonadaceae bacterium]